MARQFLSPVIEDNLVQLRYEADELEHPETSDMAEAEARLLSNLVVLIAAGQVENVVAYCAELLGRLDEIRLHTGADFQLLDAKMVREDMGSDRFTYLHLHHGEVYAAQAVVKSSRPAYLDAPKATGPVENEEPAYLKPLMEEWPLKEVPSARDPEPVKIAEDLPNQPGSRPSIMEFARRLVAMPEELQHKFEQSGPVMEIVWEPSRATFRLVMACGVEWYFNQHDATPNRMIRRIEGGVEFTE